MKPNKDKVRMGGYVQSYGEGLVPLYRVFTDEYGHRWRFEKEFLHVQADRDALVRKMQLACEEVDYKKSAEMYDEIYFSLTTTIFKLTRKEIWEDTRCEYCKRTPTEAKGGYRCTTCNQGDVIE